MMNLKNKRKKFFTLSRRHEAGFTLIELIVVIAILGILGGVGTVAYSGYMKKANKAADQALVSDVAKALQMYYYDCIGNGTEMGSGYVVLTQTGASGDGTVGNAAMQAAFGDAWESTSLAYGDWTDDGLLRHVLDNANSAGLIADSTFLTTATPDSLMNAVNNLTDAATTVIKNYNGDVAAKLGSLLNEEFVTNLNNTGVTKNDESYETVVSNMLVGHFAGVLNEADASEVMQDEGMVGMMMTYATLYAYCETIGDTTTMQDIDAYLASSNTMDNLKRDALVTYVTGTCTEEFINGYALYNLGEDGHGGRGVADVSAALEIMGAVNLISGTYTDAEDLSNPNLYSSESVAAQLDNYISAIKAVAKMDDETIAVLSGLGENDVVIFVSEDGAVSVVPGAVYLASRD